MRNRKSLFLNSTILRGRRLKDGEEGAGGGGGGNNTPPAGGNPGESGSGGGTQNNTSETFDASTFWDGPPADKSTTPSGESAGGGTPAGGTQEQNQPGFAEQLNQQLGSLTFGDAVFDAAIAEEINGGNFEGANKRIQASMQAAVRNSLSMQVQILRPFAEQLMSQVEERINSTLSSRDNTDTLVRDFPAAKDPKVAPVIRSVFDQALKNTGGDRAKAVSQTKQMIALLANTAAGDLNLNVAPRGADDSGSPPNSVTNWLDELTSR